MSEENIKTEYVGTHKMVPREQMVDSSRILRDTYAIKPGAPLLHREFGYFCLDEWCKQGLDAAVNWRQWAKEGRDPVYELAEIFGYHPPANYDLRLNWSAPRWNAHPEFVPGFEEKVIEERGDVELVQDSAGRHVLCFKDKRSGFMPEYIEAPVKDMKSWEKNCKWRMDPETPERWKLFMKAMTSAQKNAALGKMITQRVTGGFMYLRNLLGPERLLYSLYDMPEVIHDCMQTWLTLHDACIMKSQQYVTIDEIFFSEDIAYKNGSLCSPDMMKEFLFPYYQQLINNIKSRQLDKSRHLYVQVDSDGLASSIIPHYQKAIGMDVMSPFEVASGCDVVEIGKRYPDLIISGGIDKRELAKGKDSIDRMLERILPFMRERGGYIPTCDHGVPAEVSLENYLHYRKRCVELGG